MRPLFALMIVVGILGGLQLYMTLRAQPEPWQPLQERVVRGDFEILVTLTFDAGPDPFAVDLDDAPSLLVTFRGRELLRETGMVPGGEPRLISAVEGIVAGPNEIFVQASPQDRHAFVSRALRIRVLRDDRVLGDRTLWSAPGEPVEGVIVVDVDDDTDLSHDHAVSRNPVTPEAETRE